ncbi:thioredoxin, mitochondrial isoform X1 [Ranitomeya imitator]|uniref:thioredoxin, mitochondrial isoform X1 n=1 Tax=Ranitomeya imitator TaxID=111125 RepID=UPI0037E7818D
MAQRLMLKQFISSFGRSFTGPVQPLPGYHTLCTQTHGLLFKASAKPTLTSARTIHVSQTCRVTFNVQNKDDFQDRVVGSESPVIVDFHAQWCGPCKILGTRLEKVVAKQQGKVLMAKVDIDDHTDLALEYKDPLQEDRKRTSSYEDGRCRTGPRRPSDPDRIGTAPGYLLCPQYLL